MHQPHPENQMGPLQATPYGKLRGKGGRTSKETPLVCRAPDGRPSHGNSCWRHFADTECCQGKGPLVGLLLPFLKGEHQNILKVEKALRG